MKIFGFLFFLCFWGSFWAFWSLVGILYGLGWGLRRYFRIHSSKLINFISQIFCFRYLIFFFLVDLNLFALYGAKVEMGSEIFWGALLLLADKLHYERFFIFLHFDFLLLWSFWGLLSAHFLGWGWAHEDFLGLFN